MGNAGATSFLRQAFPSRPFKLNLEAEHSDLMMQWLGLERKRAILISDPVTSPTVAQIAFHKEVFQNRSLFKRLTADQRAGHYERELRKVRDAWRNYRDANRQIFMDQSELAKQMTALRGGDTTLDNIGIRHPITGTLSAGDVAYIWSGEFAHVDDMVSNMIDTGSMTIQSKDEFIALNMNKAERAAGTGSAAQYGFNTQSLSDVYDGLMRSLSLEPTLVEHFTPAIQLFKGLQDEAATAFMSNAVDDKALGIINDWLLENQRALKATGLYNKTPSPENIPGMLMREDGTGPLVLYHGSVDIGVAEGVDVTRGTGFLGGGFYVDTETAVANAFTDSGFGAAAVDKHLFGVGPASNATPVVLSPKNLIRAEDFLSPEIANSMFDEAVAISKFKLDEFKASIGPSDVELTKLANTEFDLQITKLNDLASGWKSKFKILADRNDPTHNLHMVHAAIKEVVSNVDITVSDFASHVSIDVNEIIRISSVKNGIDAVSSPNIVDGPWSTHLQPGSQGTVANSGREYVAYSNDIVHSQFDERLFTGPSKWDDMRKAAIDETNLNYREDFPDYTNMNALDATSKFFYPFWIYENQRWPWLIRQAVQKPGSTAIWGRYNKGTDGGYSPIPGTDLQINPLRGTVWMGGLRRLYQRDFPEYADQFEQPVELLDTFSRWGFYPGFHIAAPQALFGARARSAKPQVGELLPPWATTMLSALTNVAPSSAWAQTLTEQIFPDRFRDYRTMIAVNDAGGDGFEILNKIRSGTELTKTEDAIWVSARQRVLNIGGVLDAQFGLFRFRPEEMEEAYAASQAGISELTGLPIEAQEQMQDRFSITGKRYTDVFKLDPLEQYVMREVLEKNKKWLRPNIAPLLPSVQGDIAFKTTSYYNELEDIWTAARTDGFFEDVDGVLILRYKSLDTLYAEWSDGRLSTRDWENAVQATQQQSIIRSQALGEIDYYKDVPKTRNQREAFFQRFDIPIPTYSAGQELLWAYYDVQPLLERDEEGVMRVNWEKYFLEIDIILSSMLPPEQDRLLTRIQSEWTEGQRLRWKDSQDYLRPYRNVARVVKAEFTSEEQLLIEKFQRSDAPERERIRQEATEDGQLIATYERKVQAFRRNLRLTNHELDAKLLFWDVVQKPLSTNARLIANDLLKLHRPGAPLFTVEIES